MSSPLFDAPFTNITPNPLRRRENDSISSPPYSIRESVRQQPQYSTANHINETMPSFLHNTRRKSDFRQRRGDTEQWIQFTMKAVLLSPVVVLVIWSIGAIAFTHKTVQTQGQLGSTGKKHTTNNKKHSGLFDNVMKRHPFGDNAIVQPSNLVPPQAPYPPQGQQQQPMGSGQYYTFPEQARQQPALGNGQYYQFPEQQQQQPNGPPLLANGQPPLGSGQYYSFPEQQRPMGNGQYYTFPQEARPAAGIGGEYYFPNGIQQQQQPMGAQQPPPLGQYLPPPPQGSGQYYSFPQQGQPMQGNMQMQPMQGNMQGQRIQSNMQGQPMQGNFQGQLIQGNLQAPPIQGNMQGLPMQGATADMQQLLPLPEQQQQPPPPLGSGQYYTFPDQPKQLDQQLLGRAMQEHHTNLRHQGHKGNVRYFFYDPRAMLRDENGVTYLPPTVYDSNGRPLPLQALQGHDDIIVEPPRGATRYNTTSSNSTTATNYTYVHPNVVHTPVHEHKKEMPTPPAWGSTTRYDSSIIVCTVGVMALLVGAISARRMRSRSLLSMCIENETLEDDVAYDTAYTVTSDNHYNTFNAGWKGDLEKFDV